MTSPSDERDDHIKDLLRVGTRLGYLTYEELNEQIPDELITPEKLNALLSEVDRLGIRLIDDADIPEAW